MGNTEATNSAVSPEIARLTAGLIISPKEARKILGNEFDSVSDDELADLIFELTSLAQEFFKQTTNFKVI